MHQLDEKDKSNLTQGEQNALEEAQRRGYVRYKSIRCERERPRLLQMYYDWCSKENIPCVEVKIVGRYATVNAGVYDKYQWGVSLPIFNRIKDLIEQETTGIKGAKFDLDCHFCTICHIPKERADAIATALFRLYQLALHSRLDCEPQDDVLNN